MQPIPVVTGFLLRRDGGDQVLILRRSSRVRSFPGRWAGVSGHAEEPPDRQVLVEIEEETGLAPAAVRLLAKGPPLAAQDRERGRLYTVHPYLFEVERPEALRLDWEHTACKWVAPASLGRFRTVPRLADALAAVYPPVSPEIECAVKGIREDASSGARELARRAVDAFVLAVTGSGAPTVAVLKAELRRASRMLGESRPSMASLANIAAALFEVVAEGEKGLEETKRLAIQRAVALGRDLDETLERTIASARGVLSGTIVTLSYSSTVVEVLKAQRGRLSGVLVGEGRPGLEGRRTAECLARAGVPVTIATDAAIVSLVQEADAVVVGADAVTSAGAVINKAGTYALALAARKSRKPIFVVADWTKIWPRSRPPSLESGPEGDLWPQSPDPVARSNVLFDVTPPELVTAFVTEDGCVDRRCIARRARELRPAVKRLDSR